ncbi:hypothetical protein DFH08DRAFT_795727 [Mycena albidolilacea]|uniref:Uncharacterized protein n=1 Tax=Mycena albidolilacea TaxID=1033008 RepID=A0AAD7ATH1_9AGAR|nr:hypothetical protein DFH08DRAFT_795727 [Mycena albidolilacea]
MRVLPVGLTYWCKEEGKVGGKVGDLARESSGMTHPNAVGQEACLAWATCIAWVEALATDVALPAMLVHNPVAMEVHYAAHYCLLHLTAMLCASTATATAEDSITNPNTDTDDLVEACTLTVCPQAAVLPLLGYLMHTLTTVLYLYVFLPATLYMFLAISMFEAGALLMANMGGNADTVAAVYGGAGRHVDSNRELRDLSEVDVVHDCAHRDNDFIGEVNSVGGFLHDPGQQQKCSVWKRWWRRTLLKLTSVHCASNWIYLDEEEIQVLALGGSSGALLDVVDSQLRPGNVLDIELTIWLWFVPKRAAQQWW